MAYFAHRGSFGEKALKLTHAHPPAGATRACIQKTRQNSIILLLAVIQSLVVFAFDIFSITL